MRKAESLSRLLQVCEAKYNLEYEAIKDILRQEANIQVQLNRLDAQVVSARSESQQTLSVQMVGVDVLWRGWESRTRRLLNTELAQVRAKKLDAMGRLRKAFGQKEALQQLEARNKSTQKKREVDRHNDNLVLGSLLTSTQNPPD